MSSGTAEGELLTVREVASLLRLQPDTLYRWAREGRLPAIKLGKEWRVHPDDIERLLGRSVPRPAREEPTAGGAQPGSEPGDGASSGDEAARESPGAWAWPREALERDLRRFVQPRDHLLALAGDDASLAWLQGAFWQLAVWAGGPLVLPRRADQIEATRRQLFAAGIDIDRGDRVRLVEVAGENEAREEVASTASGGPVWACYGLANSLAAGAGAVEAHEHRLDAGIVVHPTIALCGVLASGPSARGFDAQMRLEACHRGVIRVAGGRVLFSRNG